MINELSGLVMHYLRLQWHIAMYLQLEETGRLVADESVDACRRKSRKLKHRLCVLLHRISELDPETRKRLKDECIHVMMKDEPSRVVVEAGKINYEVRKAGLGWIVEGERNGKRCYPYVNGDVRKWIRIKEDSFS